MGQLSSTLPYHLPPLPSLKPIDPERGLFMNVSSGKIYVKNDVQNIEDVQYELEIYQFRRMHQKYLVTVDYCSVPTQNCSLLGEIKYFIEMHQHTLFQIKSIEALQGIRMLMHVLKGYQILYQRFGFFSPSAKQIFFNAQDQPKVWINENPKLTRNIQYPNCPKTINYQNELIREVLRLFDSLRDKQNPLFVYSDCLQVQGYVTFGIVREALLRKEAELQNMRKQKIILPFADIKNIQRCFSPSVSRPTMTRPVCSLQNLPINSPRMTVSPTCYERMNVKMPKLKISYCSPQKIESVQPNPSLRSDQLRTYRQSVKVSLKKSTSNTQIGHRINPSRQFTSTMPTSLRNSKVQDRNGFLQMMSPQQKSKSNVHTLQLQIKKQQQHRFSEGEPTSFGKSLHFSSFNCKKNQKHSVQIKEEQSMVQLQNVSDESKRCQQVSNAKTSGISAEQSFSCKDHKYHTHKRHKTDFKLHKQTQSDLSIVDHHQKSAIQRVSASHLQGRFNVDTIKSIHLLEEDREEDDIIVDLKKIINKYRLKG